MHIFSCFSPCIHAPADGNGARCGALAAPPPPPIMESCVSEALTNTAPVQILSGDAQPWRVASPQDQQLLSQLSPGCLTPLTLLGEGAYGCVELCRVSVPLPINSCIEDAAGQQPIAEQRSTNAPVDSSAISHLTADSCEDFLSSFRNPRAAGPSSAAGSAITVLDGATGSEAVLSPREEIIVRPGGFSVNRLCVSPQASEPSGPSPCATPPAARRLAPSSRQNFRHGPLRASAPAGGLTAASAGFVGGTGGSAASLAAGGSPAGVPLPTASGAGLSTPTSSLRAPAADVSCGNGGYGRFTLGSLLTRARSAGSATAAQLLPPPACSIKLPPTSSSAAHPSTPPAGTGSGGITVSASAMLSNELVVAVKRIGYRRPTNRSVGGRGREPDGCAAYTGGGVGRGGRGGCGPSRTRLHRMQAIELLQLARCRECPFIVRVFGCVQDDPRPVAVSVAADSGDGGSSAADGGGKYATTGVASTPKQSPGPSKSSPWRPPASSSSPSCRIVMEWAEGGDLGSLIKTLLARRGPCSDPARERLLMSEASARFYFACLLEALSFLHGKGLLHRDVKPANLLLTSDGRAKLGDLGMVCHMDREGLAAGRAGTPNYMAPEVWAYGTAPKYSSYGANADLWSAGLVLYEMLTGHLPASHPDEYLRRSWCFTPRHSAFSPELRDLLGRLLVPRPRRRLQSCAEVVAHPWFAGFDWQGLRDCTLAAPYVPAAHRPPCNAVSASAVRLRPPLGAALAAAAGASVSTASLVGGGVALMPPVLEENAPSAAASGSAAEGCHYDSGSHAAAGIKSIFCVPSADALRQSAPAGTTGAATATALLGVSSAATQAVRLFTAPVPPSSGRPVAAHQPTLRSASTGATCRRQPPPPSAVASPEVATMGPVSVWGMLGWPAATRPSPAAASAPVSVASSMTSSMACMSSSQGTWRRHGSSRAVGYTCDAGDAGRAAGTAACPVSIGSVGAMLVSAFAPVVSCPKPVSTTAPQDTASAAASFIGYGTAMTTACSTSAESDAGMAATCIEAAYTTSGSVASPWRKKIVSGVQNRACCVSPAFRISCDASPLLMSTAATATSTVSNCVQSRDVSETFPAAGGGSSGSAAAGTHGHCHEADNGGGSSAPQPIQAGESLLDSIELQPSLDTVTVAQPQNLTRFSGYGHTSARSTEPTLCSADNLRHATGQSSPWPRTAPVCFAPAATSPQTAIPQSGILSAISSLQIHVQGLGPTGRRAGTWLQQRLADAATLAATLPEQLHFAAATAAAVVVGGLGCAGSPPASAASRLSQSESAGGPGEGALEAMKSSICGKLDVASGNSGGNLQVSSEAAVEVIAQVAADVQGGGAHFCESTVVSHHLASGGSSNISPVAESHELAVKSHGNLRDNSGNILQPGDGGSPPCTIDPNNGPDGETVAADAPDAAAALNGWRTASSFDNASGIAPKGAQPYNGARNDNSSKGVSWPIPPLTGATSLSSPPTLRADLTQAGADAATVLVLVRRNTGCSGAPDTSLTADPATGGNSLDVRILTGGSGCDVPVSSMTKSNASFDSTVKTATARISSRRDESFLASSTHQAASRNALLPAHKRTGSFCFDPLEQGRIACQQPALPSTPPSSTHCSATPGRSHIRGTSFSFDVGSLLSAGLLLASSAPLLSGGVDVANDASRSSAPAAGSLVPDGFPAGRNGTFTAVDAIAVATTAGLSSPGGTRQGWQLSSSGSSLTSGGDRTSCLPANSSPPSGFGSGSCSDPSSVAMGTLGQVSGALTGGGSGPVARVPNPSHGALEYPGQEYYWHQFPSGEAVVLLYAACMAVLVMAWAVIREGPEAAL